MKTAHLWMAVAGSSSHETLGHHLDGRLEVLQVVLRMPKPVLMPGVPPAEQNHMCCNPA